MDVRSLCYEILTRYVPGFEEIRKKAAVRDWRKLAFYRFGMGVQGDCLNSYSVLRISQNTTRLGSCGTIIAPNEENNVMKQVFTIGIQESVIDDLKNRLAITRWTDEIDNDKWQYGTSEKYLKELCDYWQNHFDWKSTTVLSEYIQPF